MSPKLFGVRPYRGCNFANSAAATSAYGYWIFRPLLLRNWSIWFCKNMQLQVNPKYHEQGGAACPSLVTRNTSILCRWAARKGPWPQCTARAALYKSILCQTLWQSRRGFALESHGSNACERYNFLCS